MLVLSASGAQVSVALFEDAVLRSVQSRESGHRASQALIELTDLLLAEARLALTEVDVFAADRGPGSFIGVRVGITLVKSWAYALDKPCAGISAFDLIPDGSTIQSRKGFYFVRDSAGLVRLEAGDRSSELPNASRAKVMSLVEVAPEQLLPDYVLEPSISTPKVPYATA